MNSDISRESYRKTIHLASLVIPLGYYFVPRIAAILALLVMFATSVAIDLGRANVKPFRKFYDRIFGHILRHHETEDGGFNFTGGTYIILGFLLSALLFPKPLGITAMMIVIICDSMAAIIGKLFGKTRLSRGKTLEGSLAFLISGLIVVYLSPKVTDSTSEIYIAIISVALTTLIELVPLKLDDNVVIPVFFGGVYILLTKIFLS